MFDDKLPSPLKSNGAKPGSAKPTKRAEGGWADDSATRAPSALEKRFSSMKLKKRESEEDVPVIPELDTTESDENKKIPMGPSKSEAISRTAAYKELNANSLSKQNISHFLEGVDLRVLSKNLLPESQLIETDIPWNWDVLFAEMVPELSPDGSNNSAAAAGQSSG